MLACMSAPVRHPWLFAYLVGVILIAWWPWNGWMLFFAGFPRLRRSYKRAMARDAASEAARSRDVLQELEALVRRESGSRGP
jgi:hypothetical protein